uniref:ORF_04R n=1 Tax=Human herpesvirus 1 (strain R15) TaxID=36345 RepID=Q6VB61_HHV1R|nr:ORF_04R [Human alphaherpesvirus 1 strain R-15]
MDPRPGLHAPVYQSAVSGPAGRPGPPRQCQPPAPPDTRLLPDGILPSPSGPAHVVPLAAGVRRNLGHAPAQHHTGGGGSIRRHRGTRVQTSLFGGQTVRPGV